MSRDQHILPRRERPWTVRVTGDLETYWPERNPEPRFRVRCGWVDPDGLDKLIEVLTAARDEWCEANRPSRQRRQR